MKKLLMIIFILLLCIVWFAVGFRAGKKLELTSSFPFFSKEENVYVEAVQEEEKTIEQVPEIIVPKEATEENKNSISNDQKKATTNYNQKYYLVSESTSSKSIINIDSTCKINLEGSIVLDGSYTTTKDEKLVIEIKGARREDDGKVLNGVSGLLLFDIQGDNTIKLIGMDIQKGNDLTDEMIANSGIKVGNVYTLE